MFEEYNLHLRPVTTVFIVILIFSLGILAQNAFADGAQPGSCNNEYDGPITNAIIIAENQTYYPLNDSVSFPLPYYKTYYLAFTVKTQGINDQGNSLPGNVWIDQDYQGFANGGCYGTAYPNQNFTVNETISHATSTSVFWATEVSGFSYTVNWIYPPFAPQNLQAIAYTPSQINLNWSGGSGEGAKQETAYKIERSSDGGSTWSVLVLNTGNMSTTYSDTGLAHSTAYSYRVYAINSAGASLPSNVASATTFNTIPSSPTSLNATGKIIRIDLNWTTSSDNGGTSLLGYKIQRSTDNGITWNTIVQNTNSTGTAYTDSHLKPVQTYTYRVSAINSVGTSEPSNTVSLKPLSKHHA